MSYNQLSNDELVEAAAERFSLEPELALRAIESKDKDLGREYFIKWLEYNDRHQTGMKRLTQLRKELRSYSLS